MEKKYKESKVTIVGSGFSALASSLNFKQFKPNVIACANPHFLKQKYYRRKVIETNKLFSKKSFSYGNLKYELNSNIKLHDRLISGGNTGLWGGFVDISHINKNFIKKFEDNNIILKKISLIKNGYKTNNKNIRQLCDLNGNIINSSSFFLNNKNKFLHSFKVEFNKIKLNIMNLENNKNEIEFTDKLLLGISLPQLLDLLIRSNYINSDVDISLKEYSHKFKISFSRDFKTNKEKKAVIVKYSFARAIDHYSGLKIFNLTNLFKIPIYIDQFFYYNLEKANFKIDFENRLLKSAGKTSKFGDSIHYCNLEINKININNFINQISNNVVGISMPFVNQKIPGPISSNILQKVNEINLSN